jgi:hypothetical protein
MNELSGDLKYDAVKAELEELRAAVADVKAKQSGKRWRVRRLALALGLPVLVIGALAQTSDPISIGNDGIVSIGTSLNVAQGVKAKSFEGNGSALKVDGNLTASEALGKKLDLSGGQITGDLGVGGAIQAKNSDIYFTKTDHNHTGKGNAEGNAAIENAANYSGLMILGRTTASGRIVRMWDKVGIGGDVPKEALEVRGNVTADKLNGEKRPYMFEIGDRNDTTRWHSVQVPSDIVRDYLGDADGGTIKLLFRVNSTDEVRVITETVYIEQPDKSNNKTPGLQGWTRQEGGGEQGFTLRTGARADVIPAPWNWMWVRNYSGIRGRPQGGAGDREDGRPWSDYKLEFLTPPNVSATVVIYDR